MAALVVAVKWFMPSHKQLEEEDFFCLSTHTNTPVCGDKGGINLSDDVAFQLPHHSGRVQKSKGLYKFYRLYAITNIKI